MKRILDSVHGHISVKDRYFSGIIDTPHFQRLRQIEQTSTRSIFPSARHDRFIHSLGVFHIGSMICDHVMKELKSADNDHRNYSDARLEKVSETYRLACLLHDVAHAPFSHTFESYYGKKSELAKALKDSLKSDAFNSDLTEDKIDDSAYHEYASANLCVRKFKDRIHELGGDVEMLARMIIGCHYSDNSKSIENCFIDLIHGDLIDADRLDYACRDVWASGYCTSTIDLTRLISAIHIDFDPKKERYVVCYDLNSINEIESVMQVKDFQTQYTINHHTVKLEQWLLIKAVECLALKYFPNEDITDDDERRAKAMSELFNIESLIEPIKLGSDDDGNADVDLIHLLSDGDLIYLMKKQQDQNVYFKQWSSRQYEYVPVWKTHTEFSHLFGIPPQKNLPKNEFVKLVTEELRKLNITPDSFLLLPAKYKPKVSLKNAIFRIKGSFALGKEILKIESDTPEYIFHYLYIKRDKVTPDTIASINNALKEGITALAQTA